MLNLNDWLDEKEPSKIINAENIAFPKCKNFGIGYQGSKNRLAKEIISFLPSADYFVDLFAGGCAITHAALLSGKYKKVITNDIDEAKQMNGMTVFVEDKKRIVIYRLLEELVESYWR